MTTEQIDELDYDERLESIQTRHFLARWLPILAFIAFVILLVKQ